MKWNLSLLLISDQGRKAQMTYKITIVLVIGLIGEAWLFFAVAVVMISWSSHWPNSPESQHRHMKDFFCVQTSRVSVFPHFTLCPKLYLRQSSLRQITPQNQRTSQNRCMSTTASAQNLRWWLMRIFDSFHEEEQTMPSLSPTSDEHTNSQRKQENVCC